jgi:hypothetical protein
MDAGPALRIEAETIYEYEHEFGPPTLAEFIDTFAYQYTPRNRKGEIDYELKCWRALFTAIYGREPRKGLAPEEDPLWDLIIPEGYKALRKVRDGSDRI